MKLVINSKTITAIMQGFQLGPFFIYTWGLTAAIGVLAAVWLAARKFSAKSRITENQFWNLAILLVIAAFVGARISAILEYWSYFSTDPWATFRLWEGGFSFFGGAVGAILAGYLWSWKNKASYLYIGRLFTPAWLVGLFFGRVGCFLIHDHLGKPTTLPWGMFIQGTYRHEPALYEMIMLIVIIGLVIIFEKRPGVFCHPERHLCNPERSICHPERHLCHPERSEGSLILFPLSLLLYSFGRFFLDFTRADDPLFYSLTIAQWACLIVFFWSIFLLQKSKAPERMSLREN
jgi:prolipoprotein diacylglyceryltransferase